MVHKIFPRSSQRPKRIQKPRYILYYIKTVAVHKGIGQSFDVNTAHVLKNKKGDIDVYSFVRKILGATSGRKLKDSQINKVYTSSRGITSEPYTSSNYENVVQTLTTDLLNNKLWWL